MHMYVYIHSYSVLAELSLNCAVLCSFLQLKEKISRNLRFQSTLKAQMTPVSVI